MDAPERKRRWWRPIYRNGKRVAVVEEIELSECPVSIITPQSRQLVEILVSSQTMSKCGVSLYGPDSSKWPVRMYDAALVVQQEHNRAENAIAEAEQGSE